MLYVCDKGVSGAEYAVLICLLGHQDVETCPEEYLEVRNKLLEAYQEMMRMQV